MEVFDEYVIYVAGTSPDYIRGIKIEQLRVSSMRSTWDGFGGIGFNFARISFAVFVHIKGFGLAL